MFAHVGECRIVDHIVGETGPQRLKKVQPALAARGAEPGEIVIADLRADGVGATMAGTGVVHRDPARRLQPGPQHVAVLVEKLVLFVDQQAHHLAPGDADADRLQLHHQPLDRYLRS